MNRYTIEYQYGDYSGEKIIYADDEESAKAKMWKQLQKHMTLPMAYMSEEIIKTEYDVYDEY